MTLWRIMREEAMQLFFQPMDLSVVIDGKRCRVSFAYVGSQEHCPSPFYLGREKR